MNWKKAKTVLIYIFIAVNIFLLIYLNEYNKKDTLDNLRFKAVLENNNIEYNLKNLSFTDMVEQAEIVNFSDKDFIESFLGKKYKSEEKNVYVSEKGKLSYEDNITFTASQKKKIKGLNKENAGNKAQAYISAKKPGGKNVSYSFTETFEENGEYVVKLVTEIKGLRLFNSFIEVKLSEKGVSSVKGDFIKLKNKEDGFDDIMSSEEVILELISKTEIKELKNAEITAIELGFIKSEPGEIIPVYKIVVNNEKEIYLDARYNIKKSERILKI